MQIYTIKNQTVTPVKSFPFKKEKDIQALIENNVDEIFGLEFVSTEFTIGEFRIDSLCYNKESNSFVIIEYKKGSSYSVIDQGYSYMSKMLNNKSDFILEYNERKNQSLKRDEVDWSQSKVIFVAPSFNTYQKNSINFKDVPFELWEIQRFNNDTIALNQHLSQSNESINNISSNGGNKIIKEVAKEIKVYTKEDVMSRSSEQIRDIWEIIEEKLLSSDFEDTRFKYTKNYIRFSKNNNAAIAYFHFQKNRLKIEISGGTIYADGKTSKQFLEIEDLKHRTKRKERLWKDSGVKNIEFELVIDENESDVDYIISLIKQRYVAVQ